MSGTDITVVLPNLSKLRAVAVTIQRVLRCCNTFRSTAVVRFSEDQDTVRDLVHLEEDVVVGHEVPLACMRRVVWGW